METLKIREKTRSLFYKKISIIKDTGCHEWTAGLDVNGYGQFRHGEKVMKAHRFSWMIHNGFDAGHLFVCHKCDNPKCVNPDHLFLGDQKSNMQDMIRKNRSGIQNGNWKKTSDRTGNKFGKLNSAVISIDSVRSIISDPDTGWGSNARIAKKHGISPQHVGRIRSGKAWGNHV